MAHTPRNAKINGGIMKFSRSKMYHKKAAFVKNKKTEKAAAVKKVTTLINFVVMLSCFDHCFIKLLACTQIYPLFAD